MTIPIPLDQYILKELNVSILLFFLELYLEKGGQIYI